MDGNRRDLLAIMGLGAASVAMNTDAAGEVLPGTPCPALSQGSKEAQEAIASQLEAMAAAIRAGTVSVTEMNCHSNMNMRDHHWLDHSVNLRVEINQQKVQA